MNRPAAFALFGAGLAAGALIVSVAPRLVRTGSTPQATAGGRCRDGTPQQAADWWLRAHLRSLVAPIAADTVQVAPPTTDSAVVAKTRIDSQYLSIFRQFYPGDIADMALLARWEMPAQYEAYLFRVLGELYGTGAQVWTYDLHRCAWSRGPMIADAGGDGGDQLRSHGWIVDLNHDGDRDLLVREKIWSLDDNFRRPAKLTRDRVTVYYWDEGSAYFAETYIPDDKPLRRAFDFTSIP